MNPLLSIIIPIYNTAPYLRRCLDSVLNNTYRPYELLLVDDGSTDDSLAICREYAQRHDCICVLTQENGGVHAARNRGMDNARGEYIAFIDSDDWIDADMFTYLIRILEEHPEVCSAECGKCWHFRNHVKRLQPDREHMTRLCGRKEALELFFENRIFHWGIHDVVFRRSAVEHLRFKPAYAEDIRFLLQVFDENERFFATDDPSAPKYHYSKLNTSSMMHQTFSPAHRRELDAYLEFEQLALKYGYTDLADKCFSKICQRRLSYSSKALWYKHPDCRERFREWTADVRRDFKRAMRCRHLSPAYKAEYVLYCAFPRLMRRVNIPILAIRKKL